LFGRDAQSSDGQRGCNGFIQKPFAFQMLSQKVRELLNA
jgi:hypothetical protein